MSGEIVTLPTVDRPPIGCSEFEFRYNTRTALGYTDGERAKLLAQGAEGKRLTYKARLPTVKPAPVGQQHLPIGDCRCQECRTRR